MTNRWIVTLVVALCLLFTGPSSRADAASELWTDTWMAAPQPLWGSGFLLKLGIPERFEKQTIRQFARTSVGGSRIRVEFSNEYGKAPLEISAAGIAVASSRGSLDAKTDRPLLFAGLPGVVIPPGARASSDPTDLRTADRTLLAISIFLSSAATAGFHFDSRDTMQVANGNAVHQLEWASDVLTLSTRAFVTAIVVDRKVRTFAIATLGDSITDGNGSTPSSDRRWPDALADRMAPRGVAVLNAGISGNRLLRDGMGQSGLTRASRDIFANRNVSSLVVLLGTNDIGWPGGPFAPYEPQVRLEEMIAGYRQLIAKARAKGVRIIGATIPPLEGALENTPFEGHYSVAKDSLRQSVNEWMRHVKEFDALVDFDLLLRDPARESRLRPSYDSGDHLHPNDAGYEAMAIEVERATCSLKEPQPREC
jgi:lysophospholipase L1-like esterase